MQGPRVFMQLGDISNFQPTPVLQVTGPCLNKFRPTRDHKDSRESYGNISHVLPHYDAAQLRTREVSIVLVLILEEIVQARVYGQSITTCKFNAVMYHSGALKTNPNDVKLASTPLHLRPQTKKSITHTILIIHLNAFHPEISPPLLALGPCSPGR